MHLESKIVSYKRDGDCLSITLERGERLVVYTATEDVRRFVKSGTGGIYTTKNNVYIGYTEKNMEPIDDYIDYTYYDVFTPSRDMKHLLGNGTILGEVHGASSRS